MKSYESPLIKAASVEKFIVLNQYIQLSNLQCSTDFLIEPRTCGGSLINDAIEINCTMNYATTDGNLPGGFIHGAWTNPIGDLDLDFDYDGGLPESPYFLITGTTNGVITANVCGGPVTSPSVGGVTVIYQVEDSSGHLSNSISVDVSGTFVAS